MIVDNLNIVRTPFSPNETKTPLVIDANAVLPFSIAMQGFQAISRRRRQVSQLRGAIQLPKLPARDMLDGLKTTTRLPKVKSPGFRGAERLNHNTDCITYGV